MGCIKLDILEREFTPLKVVYRANEPKQKSVQKFLNVDPLASDAPSLSPYRYCYNNPISFIDLYGLFESKKEAKTYAKENGIKTGWFSKNKIQQADDGSYAINNYKDHTSISNDKELGVMTSALVSERGVHMRDIGIDGFNQLNNPYSESYSPDAIVYTDGADIAYVFGSMLGWASPSGKIAASAAKTGTQFTKSSLSLGREMHKGYKLAEHAPELGRFKEFTGIKGIRPDFVDFGTKTIYELKSFNPRGIQMGTQQLNKYKSLFEQNYGGTWKTVLDHY